MAKVIRMPLLSDTMTEGKIVAWNKKVGDSVKSDDVLADVETDKATMEVVGYEEGTLLYIGVETGSAAPVNGIIAIVGKPGEDFKSLLDAETGGAAVASPAAAVAEVAAAAPAASAAKVELPAGAKVIRMPLLSDTMTEGKIVSWNKKVGDTVKSDDVLADVETDKATMEVVGYEEGTLLYIGVEAGQAAPINGIIAIVGKPGTDVSAFVAAEKSGANAAAPAATTDNGPQTTSQPAAAATAAPAASTASNGRVIASPLAKKLAADKGIDLTQVSGTGDGGRITKKDIDSFVPSAAPAATPAAASSPAGSSSYVAGVESFDEIEITNIRKTIVRRLTESQFNALHIFLTIEIDMDNAIAARAGINDVAAPAKVSFNDMVVKACATALKKHPMCNASWRGDKIVVNHHVHIGVAMAVEDGLVVPVVRFADNKTMSQISADVKDFSAKAKSKKLTPTDMSGNTFTVSNLGMFGIDQFTSIINTPDACILSVGAIKQVPVVKNNQVVPGNIMKVTLACDHRVVDGAVGAAFLQTLKKYLENPVTMLA
ncbi:2-oxo acid dehydrogenase subunit E2 [Ferruginibacter sp. SUN002]|uniref:2-oxo acid dehydrogenase subunit E2 n=1 Tax=Ferruginibacter sp. SUN002 TaxID=2937789 RepID=UPI003D36EFAB